MKFFNHFFEVLNTLFIKLDPEKAAKNRIEQSNSLLLERQFKDADYKKANKHLWANNGNLVEYAAMKCTGILAWLPDETVEKYFARVLLQLAELAEIYRRDPCDIDGFGLGTVREVENALIKKARELHY